MNKCMFLILITIIMTVATTVAMSATIEVGDTGALRVVHATTWQDTHVVISPKALPYANAWKKAYRNKGIVVPITKHSVFVRDGIFHMKRSRMIGVGIIRDSTGVHLVHNVSLGSKTVLNWYVIFLLLALILLIPETFFVRRGKKKGEEDNRGAKIDSILITLIFTIAALGSFIGFYDELILENNGWSMFISGICVTFAMLVTGIHTLGTTSNIKEVEDFVFVMSIYSVLIAISLGSFFIS